MISYEEGMKIIEAYGEGALEDLEIDEDGGVSAESMGESLNVDGKLVEDVVSKLTNSVPLIVGMKGLTLPEAVQHAVGAAFAMGAVIGREMVPDAAMPDLDNVLTDEPDGSTVEPNDTEGGE